MRRSYGNVTFGSEGIRPGEYIERKEGEQEKGVCGSRGENQQEKGLAAGDRVLSRHLAEANRDEEEKRIWGKGKGRSLVEERKEDQQTTVLKEMIVAAVEEEIDRGGMTTQEMVAKVAAAELEDRRRCDNEAGEHALLEQLLQDDGMEENCGKQKNEEEQHERDEMQEESLQSKAKEAADCVVQAQKKEMLEAGRESGVKTHEESVPEVGRPYFAVSKWEEESGGACGGDQAAVRRGKLKGFEESASVHMTRKDMDALFRKVKQLSEMVENAGELLSEMWNERRRERERERNGGVNP